MTKSRSQDVCFYLCIYLAFLTICDALYEDQVGLFDWRQQYIGNSKELFFEQTPHGGSKRVFVATESNVIAALNARTGQILWRYVFEKVHGVINAILHRADILITVSGGGKTVRSWDPSKGVLNWESVMTDTTVLPDSKYDNLPKILSNHKSLLLDEENGGLAVSTDKSVKMLSQTDGSEIWNYKTADDSLHILGVASMENKLVVICAKDKVQSFVSILHLDLETGKPINDITVPAPWIFQKDLSCTLVSSKFFVCLNQISFVIMVKDVSDLSKEAFTRTKLSNLNVIVTETLKDSYVTSLSHSSNIDYFHICVNKNHNILATIHPVHKRVDIAREILKPGFYSLGKLQSKNYIFELSKETLSTTQSEELKVEVFSIKDLKSPISSLQTTIKYDDKQFQGNPEFCAVFLYSKKNDISYRLLLVNEENSISLIQNLGKNEGKILWTRNEALSGLYFAKMIELPPSASASKLELLHAEFSVSADSGILSMFINRVKSQIRQLQAFTESLRKKQRYVDINGDSHDGNDVPTLKRDQFNIIKIMLTMTKGRKMFALNSQNGEVVWSKFLPDIQKYVDQQSVTVIEQRTTAHFPLPPKCVIVAPYEENLMTIDPNIPPTVQRNNTAIYSFNPLTGEGLEKPEVIDSYKVLQVAELPFEDEKFAQVIGIVDTDYYFHVYPNTKETLSKLKDHLNSIYIYIVNKTTNSFKGYKLKQVSSEFKLTEVYSINIPEDQTILKMISKRNDEVVNSVGRVLGDHTVLYKYLNPNVLAFMTIQGSGGKGSIFVYVVDAVTGHVIYQARHKGAEVPTDIILSEHWLIYMYYNSKGRRTEISVVEFFEGYEEKNNTAFSSLDPVGAPMILSQGYMLAVGGIRAIASTNTQHGITNKNILIGLDNGYVYSLPKNFLDPRRNFKQTPMLQEEGVPPYAPELPLVAQGYINYNQTVAQIRGIHTSAAGLESTSLVLVYGLDLFFTRVTPSKMFDVLKEDFDYIFISGVLSALILTTIVVGKLSSMRALKLAWS